MRRPLLLPAAALLAALTALALIGTAFSLRPPGLPAAAGGVRDAASRAVVAHFYAAANHAIAAGDLEPLAAVVAPDLLADGSGADSGRTGLTRRLRALHAADPALRLTVAEVAVDGDLALVRVVAETDAAPAFLGLAVVERPAAWDPVDVLRLAAGRVVAHRGGSAGAGLLEPVVTAPFDLPSAARRAVVVERITLAPGAAHVAQAGDGFRLLAVEAGTVAVAALTTGRVAEPATTLTAGERLIDRTRVRQAIRNPGQTAATVLDVSAYGVAGSFQGPGGVPTATPADGVASELLAGGLAVDLPAGPLVVAVGRVTLAAGARLAWAEAGGPVLLHVESGAAGLDPGVGVSWVRTSGRVVTLGDDPLTAGDAALVVAGNPVELRAGADAPATVLIVTLLPAN